MNKKVDYDPLRDFAPVATVNTTYWVLVVSPTLPVKTMGGVRRLHQVPSNTINFAATQGTASQLIAEMFKRSAAPTSRSSHTRGAATRCRISSAAACRC